MEMNEKIPEDQRTDKIEGVHKLPLFAAAGVVILTLFVVIGAQLSDGGKVSRVVGEPVEERALLFRDGSQGIVLVHDANSKALLASFGRGEGAFVRQSMRALIHNRRIRKQDLSAPYALQKAENGQLTLMDPENGKSIGLNAFGKVATGSFAPLLTATAMPKPTTTGG
ncbi:photosynthetic complex assembly protein PuhC [Ahrensia sp. R2A130]|uniref:photosynthetic complex assembly protein PuhC n=1 Tax=Ahrensia sp. R2A130 TaxID=744979 RepID=UPI0001E08420|nr:photosynthetic complex assembly protein PuhC [Ahrensia sp. R2A130]EFL89086.1 putative photosynthetic complex assembly protein [Ahrensia sp. R2A130]